MSPFYQKWDIPVPVPQGPVLHNLSFVVRMGQVHPQTAKL